MKRNVEYQEETVNFLKECSIQYAQEIYKISHICTIIEDGLPKSWCWEDVCNE